MARQPTLHEHATDRLYERFNLSPDWLLNEIENGRFVWLKGSGNSGDAKKVRSGHLIFIPEIQEYCVVVMDDRKRLGITVLTEQMALNSTWGEGITDSAKLRAKQLTLGRKTIHDGHFVHLKAVENDGSIMNIRARTLTSDGNLIVINLIKTTIKQNQICLLTNTCTLTKDQLDEVSHSLYSMISEKKILPYCDFFISTNKGKSSTISNKFEGVFDLEEARLRHYPQL